MPFSSGQRRGCSLVFRYVDCIACDVHLIHLSTRCSDINTERNYRCSNAYVCRIWSLRTVIDVSWRPFAAADVPRAVKMRYSMEAPGLRAVAGGRWPFRDNPGPATGDWLSGRAPRSHRGGHWFDPSIAHQHKRTPQVDASRRVQQQSTAVGPR